MKYSIISLLITIPYFLIAQSCPLSVDFDGTDFIFESPDIQCGGDSESIDLGNGTTITDLTVGTGDYVVDCAGENDGDGGAGFPVEFTLLLDDGTPPTLPMDIDFGGNIGMCAYSGVGVLLPVELVRFTATLKEEVVVLHWETAMEFNNKGFDVLHSSNGRDFESIGWVAGQGNAVHLQEYDFVHNNLFGGDNYYQLRQKDYDGTTALSRIISIVSEQNLAVDIYPNPIQKDGYLNVHITLENPTNVTLQMIDLNGRIVYQQFVQQLESGRHVIDTNDMPKGMYVLTCLTKQTEQQTFRIVK